MRVTVLSHNAFWFQGMPYEPDTPDGPVEAVLNRLCRLYRECEPHVLCLQEVQDEATHRRVAAGVGMAGAFCQANRQRQYSGAIYWRQGKLASDSASGQVHPWRMWQKAAVRTGSRDLVVCNLHLPSSRQLGEEAASCARLTDLEHMLAHEPSPDVIAGDFNEGPAGSSTSFLMQQGYVDTAFLVESKVQSTGDGKPRSDQIWVADAFRGAVSGFSVLGWDELRTSLPGKTHLSDHLPLRLDLEIPTAKEQSA